MKTDQSPLLQATDLELEYATRGGRVRSLDAASITVRAGEITALVGESGSGKTTLGLAAGRLLASNAEHIGGDLRVAGTPVFESDAETLRRLRREVLGFVFQNPVAALDPTMRVGRQIALAASGATAEHGATEALEEVGLRDIPRVLASYPHELSGGMAARVGIAMALRRRPRLLIADEPTASVDATLRAKILELLVARCRSHGCALLLLTHDLHAVAHHCSHIAVMYGGRVVEDGPTAQILPAPKHPYTQALLSALPGEEKPGQRLHSIRGAPPVLQGRSPGCAFAPRCPNVMGHW
jgi:peptide/nickel transport system ATP-binding protein